MRMFLGAIYGGLLALIVICAVDILFSAPTIGPNGVEASWFEPYREVLLYGILISGIGIGAWRGHHKDREARTRRRDAE